MCVAEYYILSCTDRDRYYFHSERLCLPFPKRSHDISKGDEQGENDLLLSNPINKYIFKMIIIVCVHVT